MNATKPLLQFDIANQNIQGVPVIVVAGGSSTRMGQNKQLIGLCGVPVLVRTLKAFQHCDAVSNIILVAANDTLLQYQTLCESYMLTKVSDIVEGGNNRQESVLCGIKSLKADDEIVLIHDGARPLVDSEIINRVIGGLNEFDAVVPVVKVKDTIKQIDENGIVIKTVKRDDLVQVQTPQGVRVKKYLTALEGKDLNTFTDDASIFEAVGERVLTVTGDYKNIKITTPEDVAVAVAFLKEETAE
ncbi:MAG: 2-C-methyl-D-erythritol 4-phosphate cytidylyltransferase [Clostridia bacterium]|nr:2-C-methyl-D-erythritol 4-phosphate cytidylyltransferase [Clostridia bacterium]